MLSVRISLVPYEGDAPAALSEVSFTGMGFEGTWAPRPSP